MFAYKMIRRLKMIVSRKIKKLFRPNRGKFRTYVLFTRFSLCNDTDVVNYLSKRNISIVQLNHVKNLDELSYTMSKII